MDINSLTKAIFDEAKDIVTTWTSVIGRATLPIQSVNTERTNLFYALRFMLYMTFIEFLLHVPGLALLGANVGDKMFEASYLLESYLEFLLAACCLHLGMKLCGGRATIATSIIVFAFLTAYAPIMNVLLLPVQTLIDSAFKQSSEFPTALSIAQDTLDHLSKWNYSVIVAASCLALIIGGVYLFALYRSLQSAHSAGRVSALFGMLTGAVLSSVAIIGLLGPLFSVILRAFANATNGVK